MIKKLYRKWEKISIKHKLFYITTSLLILLVLIIYGMLYFILPNYYHKYKINELQKKVSAIEEVSDTTSIEEIERELFSMAKEQNLALVLRDSDGGIIYGRNEVIFIKYGQYIDSGVNNEYRMTSEFNIDGSENRYVLDIIMPFQPVDEANIVLRKLLPFVLMMAMIIAIMGAFIYSTVITKPLINIIEKERQEEEDRKEFIAIISHELKTPITIISGQLEGMIYGVGKYKDMDLYLKKSYDMTRELRDLVNEMVQISKGDLMFNEFKISEENIKDLIDELIKRQQFLIEEKNMNVSVNVKKDSKVFIDKEKFGKALYNIINNAIKYSPENADINIKFTERNIRPSVLEIENTGVTIDKASLKNLFTPFYRIEKSRNRKTGGSGLGLYLTAQILKKHNFEYEVYNKETSKGPSVVFVIEMRETKINGKSSKR